MNFNQCGLLTDLTLFHVQFETWHEQELTWDELVLYFKSCLDKNRLLYELDAKGHVIAYCEYWCLDEARLGRIVLGEDYYPGHEDIETGDIIYIANLTVAPRYEQLGILRDFKQRILYRHPNARYFCGHRGKQFTYHPAKGD